MSMLFRWDPQPVAFTLPGLNLDIAWYGILFMGGFFLSAQFARYALFSWGVEGGRSRGEALVWAKRVSEELLSWAAVGAVLGGRLLHCLAYDPWRYLSYPLEILNIRQGGLASHGGILGMALALLIVQRRFQLPWLVLADLTALVSGIGATCIRIGNFMNQEICGIPTDGSWGVLFEHPAERLSLVARHPVQLYEALGYASLFVMAVLFWRRGWRIGSGRLAGFVLTTFFTFRFVCEIWKEEQALWISSCLTLGQWLSIPCVLVGGWLLWRTRPWRRLSERISSCR